MPGSIDDSTGGKPVSDGGSSDFLQLFSVLWRGLRGFWEVQLEFSGKRNPSVIKKIIKSIYLSCYHGRFYTTNYFQIIFFLSPLVFIVFIFERKYLKCFNYAVMNKLFMLSSGVYQFEEMHQWIRTSINFKLIQLHMLINVWFLFTDRTDKPMQLLSKAGDNYDYTTINRGKT